MDIFEASKLALFIAFVVPGFIAIKAYDLLSPSIHMDSSKKLIDAISYSCLNYAILMLPIYYIEACDVRASHPHLYVFFYFLVIFFFPILIVIVWKFLREQEFIQRFVPHPTQKPWDYFFSQRKTWWVVVTLKNGERIAGMYGVRSFSSSAPAEEQIFLEEQWILNEDGGFERPVSQSAGVIVLSGEIISIEFLHSGEEGNEQ